MAGSGRHGAVDTRRRVFPAPCVDALTSRAVCRVCTAQAGRTVPAIDCFCHLYVTVEGNRNHEF